MSPAAGAAVHPAYVVKGDDASLVGEAVRGLLAELVGDQPASMVVEEHGDPLADDLDAGPVVDALATPPFLTDRRVVVVRGAGRLDAAEAARLVACLADPVPGVVLVLVAGGGTIPAGLLKAVPRGGVVETAVGVGRARSQWFAERLRRAPVRLDARAAHRLEAHLGEDVARLDGLFGSLEAAYGDHVIGPDELEPFLGEAGGVAPWDLTDAGDAGDPAAALAALTRLLGPAGRAPLTVLFGLHRHYDAMLRLDGADATSPDEAAELIGVRSPFVARKAMDQGRRLGSAGVRRALSLLAQADLDLRGESALPDDVTLQVLVARLSRLTPPRRAAARR